MKTSTLFLMAWIFVLCCSCSSKKSEIQTAPNIVLFLVDDMGWQDTSVPFWTEVTPFNKRYNTPNMERLAKEGMKFTQAYATPVCSPTRISLMTGMNAARHHVTNWTLKKHTLKHVEVKDSILSYPMWNVNGLSPILGDSLAVHATPLPQLLHNKGYYTIHCGKAHFAAIGTPGENPKTLGFDVNIAGHAAGAPQSYLGTENFGNGKANKKVWAVPGLDKYHGQDIFLTEALTREALSTLDKVPNGQPFYLYMSHYAVHIPLYGDKRFLQKYINAGLDEKEAKYASMVEGMDKSLGDIMDYLEEKNLADNTIILFMSDNGGLSEHGRGGERNTHNKPLASGKGSMYEGGIREPMIVKWPGVTKPAVKTDTKVIIEDFFPTILEMADVHHFKTVQTIDGQSFVPVLQGKTVPYEEDRALIWHYPNKWGPKGPGIGAASTIRQGDWKLVYFHHNGKLELFNIKNDIGESTDLIDRNPEKVKELANLLTKKLQSMNAQMPSFKATGQQVPYPNRLLDK
ncbi:MAG: sulfatase [Aestuariibaculum sp.]